MKPSKIVVRTPMWPAMDRRSRLNKTGERKVCELRGCSLEDKVHTFSRQWTPLGVRRWLSACGSRS